MAVVKATRDFSGSTINRDDLGTVNGGDEISVSDNDAAYLEREGYAEPAAPDEAPAAEATSTETAGSAGESVDPAASEPSE